MSGERLFCHEPFQNLEIISNGDVFLCCPTWLPTAIGNLQNSSLPEIWNGEVAKKLRISVLDGSFQYCKRLQCPRLQTQEYPVVKISEISDFDLLEKIANLEPSAETEPKTMVWCHDFSCNLSCPSCRLTIKALVSGDRARALKVQSELVSHLPGLETLIISGDGDPFASKVYSEFLESADSRDFPKLKIFLQTNALLFNPERWQRMERIQPAIGGFFVSVDAASSVTYSQNRRGGNFEALLKSLEFISQIKKTNPAILLKLSFIVQRNNWREMEDFIDLGKKYSADAILFSRLANWGTFDPDEFALRDVTDARNPDHDEFLERLKQIQDKYSLHDSQVRLENLSDLLSEQKTA